MRERVVTNNEPSQYRTAAFVLGGAVRCAAVRHGARSARHGAFPRIAHRAPRPVCRVCGGAHRHPLPCEKRRSGHFAHHIRPFRHRHRIRHAPRARFGGKPDHLAVRWHRVHGDHSGGRAQHRPSLTIQVYVHGAGHHFAALPHDSRPRPGNPRQPHLAEAWSFQLPARRNRENLHRHLLGVVFGAKPRDALHFHRARWPLPRSRPGNACATARDVGDFVHHRRVRERFGKRACMLRAVPGHALYRERKEALFSGGLRPCRHWLRVFVPVLRPRANSREYLARPVL